MVVVIPMGGARSWASSRKEFVSKEEYRQPKLDTSACALEVSGDSMEQGEAYYDRAHYYFCKYHVVTREAVVNRPRRGKT